MRSEENSHKNNGRSPTDAECLRLHLVIMGYYADRPPRHGHRTPSELAEDEILSALSGDFCGMPASVEQTGPTTGTESVRLTRVALLPWADAHPFTSTSGNQPRRS